MHRYDYYFRHFRINIFILILIPLLVFDAIVYHIRDACIMLLEHIQFERII